MCFRSLPRLQLLRLPQRPLFARERNDGLYTVSAFLGYKMLEETVMNVPITLIMCLAVYFATGLKTNFAREWWGSGGRSSRMGATRPTAPTCPPAPPQCFG